MPTLSKVKARQVLGLTEAPVETWREGTGKTLSKDKARQVLGLTGAVEQPSMLRAPDVTSAPTVQKPVSSAPSPQSPFVKKTLAPAAKTVTAAKSYADTMTERRLMSDEKLVEQKAEQLYRSTETAKDKLGWGDLYSPEERAETERNLATQTTALNRYTDRLKQLNTPPTVVPTAEQASEAAKNQAEIMDRYSKTDYKDYIQQLDDTKSELEQESIDLHFALEGTDAELLLPSEREQKTARMVAIDNELKTLDKKKRSAYDEYQQYLQSTLETDLPAGEVRHSVVREGIDIAKYIQDENYKGLGMAMSGVYAEKLDELTVSEKNTLLYYMSNNENDKAEKYLDSLDRTLNARRVEQKSFEQQKYAEQHPIISAAGNIAASPLQIAGYLANAGQVIKNAVTGEYVPTDYNSAWFDPARFVQSSAAGINTATGKWGEVAAFLSDTALSLGSMAVLLPLGPASLAVLAGEAAGASTLNALQRGASPNEAFALGTVVGVVEALTEKVPLDNLFKLAKTAPVSLSSLISDVLRQAGTEATEEAIADVAGNIADLFIMGDRSEIAKYQATLESLGMNSNEAAAEAFGKYFIENTLSSAASGLLMGGILGAGALTAFNNPASENIEIGSAVRTSGAAEALIESGLESSPDTDSYQIAKRLSDKEESGGYATAAELGELQKANAAAIEAEQKAPPPQKREPSTAGSSFGENGRAVFERGLARSQYDTVDYFADFAPFYNAGLTGRALNRVPRSATPILDGAAILEAYNAGVADAAASLNVDSSVRFTSALSKDGGFIPAKGTKLDAQTVRTLNGIGRALGLKIRTGGISEAGISGRYENGVVSIAAGDKESVMSIARHEITHHLKEAAPKQYREYRNFVANELSKENNIDSLIDAKITEYADANQAITREGALDELAAEYAAEFFTNSQTFANLAEENYTLAERILSALRNIISKIRNFKGTSVPVEYREAEKKWTDALNAAKAVAVEQVAETRRALEGTSHVREIKRLNERVKQLEGQFKHTPYGKRDIRAVERYARELIQEYSSEATRDKLSVDLTRLYDRMATGRSANGEPLTFGEAHDEALDIAYDVLNKPVEQTNPLYDEYSELRSMLKKTSVTISAADKADFESRGGYGQFHKDNFGRLRLSKDGLPVDMFYQELSNSHPDFFPSEITNPAEQLMQIADVAESLRPVFGNPYGRNGRTPIDIELAAGDLANTILEAYYSIPTAKPTFADKQALKIEDIKIKSRERVNRAIEREKAWQQKQVERIAVKYAEQAARSSERRFDADLRMKIRKQVKSLTTTLAKPSDTKHVPENLRVPLASFLSRLDVSSDRMDSDTRNELADISEQLARIAGSNDTGFDIDPDLTQMIENVREIMKSKNLGNMNRSELEDVYNIVSAFRTMVTNSNKLLTDTQKRSVDSVAHAVINDLRTDKGYTERSGIIRQPIADLVNMDMLDSFTFFEKMGKTMNVQFERLRDSMDTKIRHTATAQEFITNILTVDGKRIDISEWSGDKARTTTFKLESGDSITLTPAQVMSLHRLHKQDAALKHIYEGGMSHSPIVKKGKIEKQYTPSHIWFIGDSDADIIKITDSLTDDQKRVADAIGSFFTEVTAEWGNEVSMLLYGYKKFTVKDYFPIVSNKNYTSTVIGEVNDSTLKNMGMTKSRVEYANNPVIIEDIFDVYTRQADQMGSYNAFVPALTDLQKIYNFRDGDGSVKSAIEKRHGTRAQRYFTDFVVDVNGGLRARGKDGIMSKLTATVKAASVGANISVVVQQPTSILRAMCEINPKYLAGGMVGSVNWETVKKYAPIAQWKDWGYYQMDTGRQMKDVILDQSSVREKVIEKSMGLAGKADEVTWKRIWHAVELETADKRPDLRKGTEDFYKHVGKRFTAIIDKTQVVDSIFHRTQMMRNNSDSVKMLTSFMAEPMKTFNVLYRAAMSGDRRKIAMSVVAVVLSTAAANAVKSLISAFRDDEENKMPGETPAQSREKYFDKWLSSFLENMVGEPLSMFPYVRDIYSIIQGFDVERMDMSGFAKLVKAALKFADPKTTVANDILNFFSAAGSFLGIPAYTIKRDIEALHRKLIPAGSVYEYNVEQFYYNIDYVSNRARFAKILYMAWLKEDKTDYEAIRADLLTHATYTVDGEEKELFTEKYLDDQIKKFVKKTSGYTGTQGEIYSSVMSDLESSSYYNKLPAELQEKADDKVEKYANTLAMLENNPDYEIPQSFQFVAEIQAGASVGLEPWQYILYEAARQMYDENANKSTDQDEAYAAIESLPKLSQKEKKFLYYSTNSAWKHGPYGDK